MSANVPLTESQVPDGGGLSGGTAESPAGTLAGNWADDDALALDQYFEAADQAPERFDGLWVPQDEIEGSNRLVTSFYLLPAPVAGEAFYGTRVLNPDIRRRHIYLYARGVDANCQFALSGEQMSFQGPLTNGTTYPDLGQLGPVNGLILPASSSPTALGFTWTIDDYTGALYLTPVNVGCRILVNIACVTK